MAVSKMEEGSKRKKRLLSFESANRGATMCSEPNLSWDRIRRSFFIVIGKIMLLSWLDKAP